MKLCDSMDNGRDCVLLNGHIGHHASQDVSTSEWFWWDEEFRDVTRMHAAPIWMEPDADGIVVKPMVGIVRSQAALIETLTSALFNGAPMPPLEGGLDENE